MMDFRDNYTYRGPKPQKINDKTTMIDICLFNALELLLKKLKEDPLYIFESNQLAMSAVIESLDINEYQLGNSLFDWWEEQKTDRYKIQQANELTAKKLLALSKLTFEERQLLGV